MILKIASIAFVLSTSASFAVANDTGWEQSDINMTVSRTVDTEAQFNTDQYSYDDGRRYPPRPRPRPLYVCSSHNDHHEYQIYWGQRSYDYYEAQHSAIEQCEAYEGQRCRVHYCYRVRGH